MEGFELGRHHYEAQFFLINCSFPETMADRPIFLVKYPDRPEKNRPYFFGDRYYFYNCTKEGGDYSWYQNNLQDYSETTTPEDITAKWTFDNAWDPESKKTPQLEKFVLESKEKGAHPIILSPIVRRHFNDKGTLIDTHGLYPLMARDVAKEQNIPFIDLQWKTEELVAKMGPDLSKSLYLFVKPGESEMYPEGRKDSTHLCYTGAKKVSELVCEDLKEQVPRLAIYLK